MVDPDHEQDRLPTWLSVTGLLVSLGAIAKSVLVSNGIIWDEKPAIAFLLVSAALLNIWSLVVNVKRSEISGVQINVVSFLMLATAIFLTFRAWR